MQWLGIQTHSPASEQATSTIGSGIAISLICLTSYLLLDKQGTLAIVPSMGASAVLLFAVPHGPLSQPWALFAGHLISAVIGVSVATLVPDLILASGLAVGLAIGAMLLFRCTHPPGGATALAAVIGGDSIHQLGYFYLLTPVLINVVIIFAVALVFNNLFPWRRYPSSLQKSKPISISDHNPTPSQAYLAKALEDQQSLIDVSPRYLQQIYRRAEELRLADILSQFDFEPGALYTNNKAGKGWAVRRIVDYNHHPDPTKDLVIYKTIDGAHKGHSSSCTRAEFAQWARQKLAPSDTSTPAAVDSATEKP